ncbi:MAG: hypothetical protein HQK92_08240 [Nitrospirae bacterium]|nr:hypothetical protein [Nitrospirota bacterium]
MFKEYFRNVLARLKSIKSIKTKLLIRIVISFVIMSTVVQGIVFVRFRALSLETAKEKALSVAELIRFMNLRLKMCDSTR